MVTETTIQRVIEHATEDMTALKPEELANLTIQGDIGHANDTVEEKATEPVTAEQAEEQTFAHETEHTTQSQTTTCSRHQPNRSQGLHNNTPRRKPMNLSKENTHKHSPIQSQAPTDQHQNRHKMLRTRCSRTVNGQTESTNCSGRCATSDYQTPKRPQNRCKMTIR